MLIALLDLRTTPADRAVALAHLDDQRDKICAMPGNIDFRVYAARDDDPAAGSAPLSSRPCEAGAGLG